MTDKEVMELAQGLITVFKCDSETMVDFCNTVIKKFEQPSCEDYISREQTLKAFAEKCGGECACCEYNGSGYDTAENCKLIKSIPSVTPQTRWIPIEDALPKEDEIVMVTTEINGCRGITDAMYFSGSSFWNNYVVAWMPCIELYKKESEDKK